MDSRLEEFEKKLYERKEGETVKRKGYEAYKEEDAVHLRGGWEKSDPASLTVGKRKIRVAPFLVIAFFALLVSGGYYLFTRERPFDIAAVRLSDQPVRVSSGDEASYVVTYRNNTSVALRGGKIIFTWPEGAVVATGSDGAAREVKEDVGMIVPGQEKSATFKGRIYGTKDEQKKIAIVFQYTPESVAAVFEDKKTVDITIAATPIALIIQAPGQAVSGKEVEIAVEYQNQSDAPFNDMTLRAVYPGGFTFVSAEPAPSSENNTWKLGAIDGRASGKIIKSLERKEIKSVYIELGIAGSGSFVQYARADSTVSTHRPHSLCLTANDSRDHVIRADPFNSSTL